PNIYSVYSGSPEAPPLDPGHGALRLSVAPVPYRLLGTSRGDVPGSFKADTPTFDSGFVDTPNGRLRARLGWDSVPHRPTRRHSTGTGRRGRCPAAAAVGLGQACRTVLH